MSKDGNRIAEGNLAIMLFDGWKKESRQTLDPDHNTQNPGSNTYYVYVKEGREIRPEDIEFDIVYHKNWDAIMPVVEKMVHAACELPTIELRKEARKRYDLIEDQLCNFILSGVHLYSVQFIQWYNSTLKQKP